MVIGGQAFAEIYNISFPEDIDVYNDYSFDIKPESFSDIDHFIFLCKIKYRIVMK